MRFLKAVAVTAVGVAVALLVIAAVGLAAFLGFFWFDVKGPSGTVEEATVVVRTHRADVRQITEIVRGDPSLGWVTPGLKASDMTQENGSLTSQRVRDYEALSHLLSKGGFRDLEIVRDDRSHGIEFMRFVVFDYGWFGSTKPVLAERAVPGEALQHSSRSSCRPVEDHWFVCPVD